MNPWWCTKALNPKRCWETAAQLLQDFAGVDSAAFGAVCGWRWWAAGVAILLAKQAFGGIGNNIFNPALVGRAVLFMSWPVLMTRWHQPLALDNWFADLVSGATPLGAGSASLIDLVLGNVGGSLGETSVVAILLGGIYLLLKGHIDWRIPGGYIGTAAIIALLTNRFRWKPWHFISAPAGCSLALSLWPPIWLRLPPPKWAAWLFGIGCGLVTMYVRVFASAPEGVTYAIFVYERAGSLN